MVSAASHDADSCFAPRQVWLRGAQNARRATVSEMRLYALAKILAFAAALEVGTGLVLLIDPAVVVRLLLGAGDAGEATLLGRFFGIALAALGLACWPSRERAPSDSSAFRAMLMYNALIALYLAYLGTFGRLWGLLLWPGVVLHAVVALLLVWKWRDEEWSKATKK